MNLELLQIASYFGESQNPVNAIRLPIVHLAFG